MHYFSEQDSQARRLLVILKSFNDVVMDQQSNRARQQDIARAHGIIPPLSLSLAEDNNDAMANLFQGGVPFSNGNPAISSPIAGFNTVRRNSQQMSFSPLNGSSSQLNNNFSSPDQRPPSRQNSIDAFFDLARLSSHSNSGTSNDGNDSLTNDEIDFEALWHFPTNSAVATPGVISSMTPGGILGGSQLNMHDIQGISDSYVPLYGLTNTDYGSHHQGMAI